jgi:hypothetical protein
MTLRSTTVLCVVVFSMNAHASDMAIVEAVTGNMQPVVSTNPQPNAVSSNTKRASSQPISKFDYTARQKAREMKCETNENPSLEPYNMGVQTLLFTCNDGRELKIECFSGIGCKAP